MVKKNSEERNNTETNPDIHGRIEYIDQCMRSIDRRLSAVEKRLSIKTFELPQGEETFPENTIITDDIRLNEITGRFHEIDRRLADFEKASKEIHTADIVPLKSQFSLTENRIVKLENQNKITIGKIKVPIEFSGLAASIVMFGTGYLIYTDHWNIIRSSYYPISIGILFGAVVIGKFLMMNRE